MFTPDLIWALYTNNTVFFCSIFTHVNQSHLSFAGNKMTQSGNLLFKCKQLILAIFIEFLIRGREIWRHERAVRIGAVDPPSSRVVSPHNFTLGLFDPRVTRLYQPGVPASKNEHSAGLKAWLMIPGPLTSPLTKLLWKMSENMTRHSVFHFLKESNGRHSKMSWCENPDGGSSWMRWT